MNSNVCTVCGLVFDNEVVVMTHLKVSAMCRINLLLRGTFLNDEQHRETLAIIASARRKQYKSGLSGAKITNVCVRSFGPHRPIFDLNGNLVEPSKRRHPLGSNRPIFLPSHVLDEDLEVETGCPVSHYTACTTACCLCKGRSGCGDG